MKMIYEQLSLKEALKNYCEWLLEKQNGTPFF